MEMRLPKVSCIIATYNRHSLLPRALASLDNQTYSSFEVIIVDDHSDIPVTINDGYSYPFKLIRLKRNSGFHARPRNIGIKVSLGKYICYLDDDDEYLPDHIEVLVNVLEQGGFDFVYSRRRYINMDGSTNESPLSHWIPDKAGDGFYIGVPDIMHTRDIIYKVGGWNEGLVRLGDYELVCRLGKLNAKATPVDKVLTTVYRHSGQMTIDPDRYVKSELLRETKVVQGWLS